MKSTVELCGYNTGSMHGLGNCSTAWVLRAKLVGGIHKTMVFCVVWLELACETYLMSDPHGNQLHDPVVVY